MALAPTDIALPDRLPDLPRSLPVFELSAPSLRDRGPAIAVLRKQLGLGELRTCELEHGTVMAGRRGEIEFFRASGAIWARNAVSSRARSEKRRWTGLEEVEDEAGRRFALDRKSTDRLAAQVREVLDSTRLLPKDASFAGIELDQVAALDQRGRETDRGAGSATVKFLYEANGMPVRGAGAKTLLFADPAKGGARISGAFHAWRPIGRARTVRLPSLERALGVGLLSDPELVTFHDQGHEVAISRIELVYLALPAFLGQNHLFPAFQVEGVVSPGKRGEGFRFGRFHHVAPPKAYAKADCNDWCLAVNPDLIPVAQNGRDPAG